MAVPRDAHAEAGQAALGVGSAQVEGARGAGVAEPAPHVGLRAWWGEGVWVGGARGGTSWVLLGDWGMGCWRVVGLGVEGWNGRYGVLEWVPRGWTGHCGRAGLGAKRGLDWVAWRN